MWVDGKEIRTTAQHPFYVKGKGWVAAKEVRVGDWFLSADGRWVAVDRAEDSGEADAVYNLRVADFHTYFVGCVEWGWSVWAHNQYKELFENDRHRAIPERSIPKGAASTFYRPYDVVENAPAAAPPEIAAQSQVARGQVLAVVNNMRAYMADGESQSVTAVAIIMRNGEQEIWVSGSGEKSSVRPYIRQAINESLGNLKIDTQEVPVRRVINPHPVPGDVTTGHDRNGLNDAERHILRELDVQPGTTLLAIGSTNVVCHRCETELVRQGLAYAIAIPTETGAFLTNAEGWTNTLKG